MAQTVIQGLRDLVTGQANLIPEQVVQNRLDLMTKDRAHWTLLTRLGTKHKPAQSWTYKIHQDLMIKIHTTLASVAAVGATTWNLAAGTGAYVTGWDILWNRTRNVFVHAQSRSTDAITVVANVDAGTDVAGQVGDEIVVLTNANQESNNIPSAKTTSPTIRTNYVQDVITAWDFSDMAMFSDSFFEQSDFDLQKMKIAIEHQRKLELMLKLGPLAKLFVPGATYTNPAQISSMYTGLTMSLRAFMGAYADSDHVVSEPDLTENEYIDLVLQPYFFADGEPQNKKSGIQLTPPSLASGIAKWNIGRGRFEMRESKKIPGFRFQQYESTFGPIKIIIDHDLQSTVANGTHYAFLVADNHIGYTAYKNLDTHIVENAIKDGRRRVVGYIRTVMGSHYTHENAHVMLKFQTTS